jgi:hypothetical protein
MSARTNNNVNTPNNPETDDILSPKAIEEFLQSPTINAALDYCKSTGDTKAYESLKSQMETFPDDIKKLNNGEMSYSELRMLYG